MATTKTKSRYDTRKALRDYYVYVPLGAGQFVIEQVRSRAGRVAQTAWERRRAVADTYREFADRGEKLVKSIRRSASTKRAAEQISTARSRVKSAGRSVGRAAQATAEATRTAAKKVG